MADYVDKKDFDELKGLVMNQATQFNDLVSWIKANKEPAPAAVTQEPKEEKKDEVPEWFKAYVAANTPTVVPKEEEKKDDKKEKKSWKETAKDVAAVTGVSLVALLGISKVFNLGAEYNERQNNIKLLQSNANDPYGGTIDATVQELDLTK